MEENDVKKILEEQLEKSKDLSLNSNDNIIYIYQDKEYKIEWNKTWDSRFGYHVWFNCNFIENFNIYNRTQNINYISITTDSIEKNNKNILRKINILTKRIREQVEINDFVKKIKKEFTKKVKSFIEKDLDLTIDKSTSIRYFNILDWRNWKRSYPIKKIIRQFNHLNIVVKIKHQNVRYSYSFKCVYPCKWNNIELKKITLENKQEDFEKNQITNIIRYAKLKNIFNNNG